MVVTRLPATAATGSTQLRVATPSKWTVHAPHCAMPQPNFVPVRPSVSRSTQSSGVSGLSVTGGDLPLTVNVIGDIGGAPREVRAQESWRGVPSDGRGGGESGCGGAAARAARAARAAGAVPTASVVPFFRAMTTYARRLGLFSGTMAVIGGIIGGGIFRTPAAVAERVGSPQLALAAWVLGGAIGLIGAFCFGELGQRRPRAGGGYVYLRETWGPLPAFLYGWALLLVIATGAIAAVAVTFANYALALAGLSPPLTVPVAIGAIALLSGINYLGVRPAAVTQNVFTILKLAALAALIVARF